MQIAKDNIENYEVLWPQLVPQTHIFECLNAYRENTTMIWTDPPICRGAVCGQGSRNCKVISYKENITAPFSIEILRISDAFIIRNCIVNSNSAEFVFGNIFDGLKRR